ncbi:hypothetical protein ACTJKQ_13445 [Acidovorax sp. 22279]|uniref:hypothetical protein n=1 Tax=Acidovorax sp. 22279 TaxID=3453900 RepID=UPI003F852263
MTTWENSNFKAVGNIGKGLIPSSELGRTQQYVSVPTAEVEHVKCKNCGAQWDHADHPSNATLAMQKSLKVRCPECNNGDFVPVAT